MSKKKPVIPTTTVMNIQQACKEFVFPDSGITIYRLIDLPPVFLEGSPYPAMVLDYAITRIEAPQDSRFSYTVTITVKIPSNIMPYSLFYCGDYTFDTYTFDCLGITECTRTDNAVW
jgi:hypothetical protein